MPFVMFGRILSLYPHVLPGKLKDMPDRGGNGTRNLYNALPTELCGQVGSRCDI